VICNMRAGLSAMHHAACAEGGQQHWQCALCDVWVASDATAVLRATQFELNDGEPVGMSIPATEHSVMTSWPSEREAILNMISQFGSGLFACVMDSYDYAKVSNVPTSSSRPVQSIHSASECPLALGRTIVRCAIV
jgi:hypothetical protein